MAPIPLPPRPVKDEVKMASVTDGVSALQRDIAEKQSEISRLKGANMVQPTMAQPTMAQPTMVQSSAVVQPIMVQPTISPPMGVEPGGVWITQKYFGPNSCSYVAMFGICFWPLMWIPCCCHMDKIRVYLLVQQEWRKYYRQELCGL